MFNLDSRCRLLSQNDINEVMQIENLCYAFPWSQSVMLDCLNTDFIALAIVIDNNIAGYTVLSYGANESHVLNLCVKPAFRGKQYGQLLLEEAIKIAKTKKVNDVYLEVRASNTIAIALYFNQGFNEIGCRKGYYPSEIGREDAIVMGKNVL